MIYTHPLILSLRSAGLKEVDPSNMDEVHYMWNAFSKAKNCIDGGDRLEYLSWRIYSREVLRMQNSFTTAVEEQDPAVHDPEQSDSDSNSDNDWENASITNEDTANDAIQNTNKLKCIEGVGNSSQVNIRRRLSSVELQHLFKDTIQIDPKTKSNSQYSKRNTSSSVSNESSASDSMHEADSSEPNKVVEKSTSPEHTKAVSPLHAQEHSNPTYNKSWCHFIPDSTYHRGTPHTYENTKNIPSPVVRGFNPSSVSVSVHRHSVPDIREALLTSIKDQEMSEAQHADDASIAKDASSSKTTRNSSRQSMFFIEPAESDSESSSADSYRRLEPHNAPSASEDSTVVLNPSSSSPAASTPTIHEVNGTANSSFNGGNDDEWDDISADEDDDDEEDKNMNSEKNELRKKAMFRERKVPLNPLLKRSLLSSLFLDKMKSSSTPSESAVSGVSTQDNSGIDSDKSGVLEWGGISSCIPTKASPKNATSTGTEWSEMGAPEIQNQKHRSQKRSTLTRTHSDSITASVGSISGTLSSSVHQPFIIARPEMYRASTTTGSDYVSSQVEKERSDWAIQHEDIYDPMNYHSRGW